MIQNETNLKLYIHIPFCVKKCDYCDFLSFGGRKEEQIESYLESLKEQIKNMSELLGKREVDSVFFGGGTPTILSAEQIAGLISELRDHFQIRDDAEITMECNPKTAEPEKFQVMRGAGINRLSIGLQSAVDQELQTLGRVHDRADFEQCFADARKAGFDNVNIDLIFGIPGQTPESLKETLDYVCDKDPEHVSAYSLIIEKGTPFFMRYAQDLQLREAGETPHMLPDEQTERAMSKLVQETLGRAGYEQYEISNYAKSGHACVHNLSYWDGSEYLGLGLGASSLLCVSRDAGTEGKDKRYIRVRTHDDLNMYLDHNYSSTELFPLSESDRMEEFMFLGLRMMRGIQEKEFERRFGQTLSEVYGDVIDGLVKEGLVLCEGETGERRIWLSERGCDVSNQVFVRFLLDDDYD